MYVHAIENEEMQGAYNAVGPYSVRNKELVLTIADILNRPRLSVPAPKIALHFVLGEMAALVLNSHNVSSEKIQQTGFSYRYNELKEALTNIYGKDD